METGKLYYQTSSLFQQITGFQCTHMFFDNAIIFGVNTSIKAQKKVFNNNLVPLMYGKRLYNGGLRWGALRNRQTRPGYNPAEIPITVFIQVMVLSDRMFAAGNPEGMFRFQIMISYFKWYSYETRRLRLWNALNGDVQLWMFLHDWMFHPTVSWSYKLDILFCWERIAEQISEYQLSLGGIRKELGRF